MMAGFLKPGVCFLTVVSESGVSFSAEWNQGAKSVLSRPPPQKKSNVERESMVNVHKCVNLCRTLDPFLRLWAFTMKWTLLYKKEPKKILWDQTLWENKNVVQGWQRREGDSPSKEAV